MLRKTTAIFLFCAFALTTSASAQVLSGLGGVGVKGGVNFAQLRGDDESTDYQTDFQVGLYGIIPTSQFFVIQPEVLYTRKGGSSEESIGDFNYNLDYIEIPVLAKVTLPIQEGFSPSLLAGPYVAFAVNRSFDYDGDEEVEIEGSAEDAFKTTDFGVALGAELDFVFAGRALTLGGRYDLGLTDISEDPDSDIEVVRDIRTGTWSVTLGFAL